MTPQPIRIVVEDSKAECPHCGKTIRVNVRRGLLYSHLMPNSMEQCPEWNGIYEFDVISLDPRQAVPVPTLQKLRERRLKESAQEQRARSLGSQYPAETKNSVRAYLGGSYGGGRNRKH